MLRRPGAGSRIGPALAWFSQGRAEFGDGAGVVSARRTRRRRIRCHAPAIGRRAASFNAGRMLCGSVSAYFWPAQSPIASSGSCVNGLNCRRAHAHCWVLDLLTRVGEEVGRPGCIRALQEVVRVSRCTRVRARLRRRSSAPPGSRRPRPPEKTRRCACPQL
jgi:hypothetical protein